MCVRAKSLQLTSVQSLSCVRLFATPWIAARQASLSITNSHGQFFVTLWTAAHQSPLSMGFSRQEYWSGVPCPPQGDRPDKRIEPMSPTFPTLAGGFFTTSATWKTHYSFIVNLIFKNIYLFYFWLCWDWVAICRLFIVALGLLSSCGTWAPEYMTSVVVTTGLDALQHVGS